MSYQARHMRGSEAKTEKAPAAQQVVPAEDSAEAKTAQVGRSAALMSVLVIVSRLTGFFRTWGQAYAIGVTVMASCYSIANNLPNQLYELVVAGMLTTAFLPVYMSVRDEGRHQGGERVHLKPGLHRPGADGRGDGAGLRLCRAARLHAVLLGNLGL
mgnify:CR=1 FL=1